MENAQSIQVPHGITQTVSVYSEPMVDLGIEVTYVVGIDKTLLELDFIVQG